MRRFIGLFALAAVFGAGFILRSPEVTARISENRRNAAEKVVRDSQFRLRESSLAAGIDFSYRSPKLAEVLAPEDLHVIGGGIAVADVNSDGLMDFYVTSAGLDSLNHLYLNQGNGTFKEAAEAWGVARLNVTTVVENINPALPDKRTSFASLFPLFFDANADGRADLLVVGAGCPKLFVNRGTHFQNVSEASGIACHNVQTVVPLDYDVDGKTDLYLVRYFGEQDLFETTDDNVWVNSSYDATNGGVNKLYRNTGDGTFEDVTPFTGGADFRWGLDAAAGDFLGDGGLEVLISNDMGPDSLYRFEQGKMVDVSSRLGSPDRRLGMGVSIGYLSEEDRPFLHVSNAFHPQYRHEGNFLWQFDPDGRAHDKAIQRGSNQCFWAWGSVFADLDLDGELDLYVANGFVSGEQREEVPVGIFVEPPRPEGDASFRMGTLQGLPGAVIGRGSVFSSLFRRDHEVGRLSFAGFQRDCVFLQRKGEFVDVGAVSGVSEDWDGRAVASIDYDNNGSLDLLVSTRNKGLKFLRNEVVPNRRWIGFEVRDAYGSNHATGTLVTITQSGKTLRRYATGGKSGFLAASDPRLHFGLPLEEPVDVEVRWPSGKVCREREAVPGGYHALCENAGSESCRCVDSLQHERHIAKE